METALAEGIVRAAEIYGAIGLAIAVPFALFGASRLDPGARGSSLAFRVMVIPGATLLWPVVLARLLRSRRSSPAPADHG